MDGRLPTKAAAGTELSEGLGEQAGAYVILPTPGRNSSSPATKGAGERDPMNFDAAGAIEVGYEEGGGVAAMMELDRGIAGKTIQGATAGAIRFVDGSAGDGGAHGHNFVDPAGRGGGATTTVDLARMKAGETVAEATSAAMQVGKEAGDFVAGAGHKLF